MTFTGTIWGYAVVDDRGPDGSGTRTTPGGGGEGGICYEYYEWWLDSFGHYREEVLYTWCEPEYQT